MNSKFKKMTLDGNIVRTTEDLLRLKRLSCTQAISQNDVLRIAQEVEAIQFRAIQPKWSCVHTAPREYENQGRIRVASKTGRGLFRCRQTGQTRKMTFTYAGSIIN